MMRILVAFLVLFSFADEHAGPQSAQQATRARIPQSLPLQDSPIFKGRTQVTYDIQKDGKTPAKRAFDKNWKQQQLAGIAKSYMGDTSRDRGIVVKFESIQLAIDPKNEDKVFLVVKTMGRQAVMKPAVDRAILESGEVLTFREHKVKDVLGVGEVTADVSLQIRFNPESKKLTLPYVGGGVKVSAFFSEESDSVEIKNLDCIEVKEK